MSRIVFDRQAAPPPSNNGRADVACFIGLVRLASGAAVPTATVTWLTTLGYPKPVAMSSTSTAPASASLLPTPATLQPPAPPSIAAVLQVPVPVSSFAAFQALFDDGTAAGVGTDYVAAAVRSFFAQGGKKAYVVRTGDPIQLTDTAVDQQNQAAALILNQAYDPSDAATWTGIGSLTMLDEVSTVLLPDLPAVCASAAVGAAGQTQAVLTGPQEFTVCAPAAIMPRTYKTYASPAPRLAFADYQQQWAPNVASVLSFLAGGSLRNLPHLREMQFVAAFPMPQDLDAAAAAEQPASAEIAQDIHDVMAMVLPESLAGSDGSSASNLSSAFLQLTYPWLITTGSGNLLEGLEPPDGALAGLIARNALLNGTFVSATKTVPAEIYDVFPALPMHELKSSATAIVWGVGALTRPLIERMSLFGFAPAGMRLLSDVTAYPGDSVRAGAVNRLVAVLLRAARRMGQTHVFNNNGPQLWGRAQKTLENLFLRLWTLGALDGDSPSDAFAVRCDRTTMTQNDHDNGRMVAQASFTPAALLETIRITLAIESSGTSAQEIAANVSSPNIPGTSYAGAN